MQTKRDSDTDVVASFDAFKVSKHGNDKQGFRWEVSPLHKWAQAFLRSRGVRKLIRDNRGSFYSSPITSVSFQRRNDALDFLRDLEKHNEGWPK